MQEVIEGVSVLKHPEIWGSRDDTATKGANRENDYSGFIQGLLLDFLRYLQCLDQDQERYTWFQRKSN